MSTVQSYIVELQAIQALIGRQSATLSADDLQKLMSLQCEAFVQKLDTVAGLDIPAVDTLTQLVQGGPWRDAHKQRLVMKFSTALVDAGPAGKPKHSKRDSQDITSFQNFAIQPEAEVIQAEDVAFKVKVSTAIKMMKRMGVILPSEDSKAHIMCVLLASCPVWMRAQNPSSVRAEYVKMTAAIRNTFKNTRNPGPQGFIVAWPDTPSALPQSQREIIFGDQEPVTLCNAEVLSEAREYIAMRGNNSLLKKETPVQTTALAMPMAMQQMMPQHMMTMMFQQMQQMMTSGARGSDDINLSFTGNANRQLQQPSQPLQGQLALAGPPHAAQQLALQGQQIALQVPGQHQGQQLALQNNGSTDSLGGHTPQASPTKADGSGSLQVSPEAQAKKFLDAMQGKGCTEDDDDDDDDDDAAHAKKKPAAKKAAKSKSSLVHTSVSKKAELLFKPKIDCEDSRKQYLFRCGIAAHAGGLPSVTFKYADHGSKKAAEKAATKHLAEFKKTHKCA